MALQAAAQSTTGMSPHKQDLRQRPRPRRKRTNRKRNHSLEVIKSHPDLVIRIKDVTLGEEERNNMNSEKRMLEKKRVTKAAYALLNSGGGVIEIQMANKSEQPVEMGQDLEQALRDLVQSLGRSALGVVRRSLLSADACAGLLQPAPVVCRPAWACAGTLPKDFFFGTHMQMPQFTHGVEEYTNTYLKSCLFFPCPVSPRCLKYTPESLWKELCSQNEGLKDLLSQQMCSVPCGLLILSRSWAVDLNLEERQGVICDALLIAENSPPTLYTIFGQQDEGAQDYCTHTAFTLKQKLVNTGGYTGRVCVTTKVLCLESKTNEETSERSPSPIDYPPSYNLANTQEMEALLQALVIVLLNFRSFLSDQLGCEILNLLTAQQYEIFSKNLRKNKELFVHGLPGSGKTVMAIKIMEKIRNTFHCEADRILYICENQRLRDLIRAKNICQAVTRKTFMKIEFETDMIQHIIVDEAQNFRTENGDWYKKAKLITQREKDCPGILWIFLDYFQTSHMQQSGLPLFSCQYPKEELTRVVRNADKIAEFLQKKLEEIRDNPPCTIPSESLEMLNEFTWAHGVTGSFELRHLSLREMVNYVANKCNSFLRSGYSPHDIAVLFSTEEERNIYKDQFLREMRKRRVSQMDDAFVYPPDMFDSIHRFSGLEKSIVFGINPRSVEPGIFCNLLLCLASRARKHLYILMFPDYSTSIRM
ncbi:schlafen family member 9-like [Alexandromys fortis]|uniref:schlafen family member 9-like n=1 Tax=Alexandromys fortis TaxID=100897 RepID=UPI002152006A|nr:schlafen family member 9-like [Microtus fortis]